MSTLKLAQMSDVSGTSQTSPDELILEMSTPSRCLENVPLISVLLFVCSCMSICAFLCFYFHSSLGEVGRNLLFVLGNKIDNSVLGEAFWVVLTFLWEEGEAALFPWGSLLVGVALGVTSGSNWKRTYSHLPWFPVMKQASSALDQQPFNRAWLNRACFETRSLA